MERIEQILIAIVGGLIALTVVAMWALWPSTRSAATDEPAPLYDGRVISAEEQPCPEQPADFGFERDGPCQVVEVEVTEGPAEGSTFTIDSAEEDYPVFDTGDRVRVGIASAAGDEPRYFVADFARGRALTVLFALFVGAVLAVGRWHGLRSLVGLGLSLLIIVTFVVPAILAGSSPFLVALVGAFAIMVVTLYTAHGLTVKTTTALVGTAAALALTALLGLIFVAVSNLTGFSSEEATFARYAVSGLDLRGLILAGLVISALGVLDDVTVSQASTVFAVHGANPDQPFADVFRRAIGVGRDHIASVVNTLVLAYVGASIPLIVLFSTGGLPVPEILSAEIVAEEIVKTLVGSIGLVAAVPFTTALATAVAVRRETPSGEAALPSHLREDVDEEELTEEELAHRRWVQFLREGDPDEVPQIPGEEPELGPDENAP